MLLPTMTNQEISKEIVKDYENIWSSSTINRLLNEYNRERKRLKIRNDAEYTKFYEIKTNLKNKWIFKFSRARINKSADYLDAAMVLSFTYFYSNKGIRVLICNDKHELNIYNRHLFCRYRERMNLDIPDFLDLVKHFFEKNDACKHELLPEVDGEKQLFSLIKEGFIMGEYNKEDHWYVFKTFISKANVGLAKNSYIAHYTTKANRSLMEAKLQDDVERYSFLSSLYKSMI